MTTGISAGFNPNDIFTVIEKINHYRNKNKNEVCLALQLMDSFIAKWHDDYVRIFSKAKGMYGETLDDETREIFQKISAFSDRIVYHRLAKECVDYLVEGLYTGYHSSGNFKFRDIIEQAGGIDHIRVLASSIDLFSQDAYGGKQQWVQKVSEDKRWNISDSDIKQMLQNLREKSEKIREITSKMRRNLGCSVAINDKLYQELSKK